MKRIKVSDKTIELLRGFEVIINKIRKAEDLTNLGGGYGCFMQRKSCAYVNNYPICKMCHKYSTFLLRELPEMLNNNNNIGKVIGILTRKIN